MFLFAMDSIEQNLFQIKKQLGQEVKLVAVSKTKPPEAVLEAYNLGQRVFGENKVQELVYKYETLPKDIQWHMIGHLQTNKVKYIAPFISLIHSVDSFKLLQVIHSEAAKNNRIIDCLLQVKIAEEKTKFGWNQPELIDLLKSDEFRSLDHVRIVGLMGMATLTDSDEQIREEFRKLKHIFIQVKASGTVDNSYFSEISMGMSDDYGIALEEGSTMVRIGSSIFGKRIYS